MLKPPKTPAFTQIILDWFDEFGRTDLPWQNTQDPYKIWVSEIMLQQTQVSTVIPYFNKFMSSFPTITSLATASEDNVLHHWTGLGYYARARNLHKAAKLVSTLHQGIFPKEFDSVLNLPGIGRSTAGAILSFSQNQRFPILDGNVKRTLCRHFGIEGWPGKADIEKQLWLLAEQNTPETGVADYTQAIMDFGATQCKRSKPNCNACPLASSCYALKHDLVTSLPSSKSKKIKPIKTVIFAKIVNANQQTLLIKRPPLGIWGGLWCLPELAFEKTIPNDEQIISWLTDQFDLPVINLNHLNGFRHTFSHYHLDVKPVIAQLDSTREEPNLNDVKPFMWFNSKQNLQIGLAAPIKKLLEN